VGRLRDGDVICIEIDRNRLVGTVNFIGEGDRRFEPDEGARILAARPPRSDLHPDPQLPGDTRLWAALQRIGGGTWGGCVYDVDQIVKVLEAGEQAIAGRMDTIRV
jgi:dihydroxyacid dehydratase/phosphogluconate dehydratase